MLKPLKLVLLLRDLISQLPLGSTIGQHTWQTFPSYKMARSNFTRSSPRYNPSCYPMKEIVWYIFVHALVHTDGGLG